ncbi:MAG TPA: metallophosphoesterase [Treponemataceae bacterium]|nr:metallophosphoesterase [Treponemataceae bacterium]
MKILCVSDQIDPFVYSANIKKNYKDIDLVLCAGDLPMQYIDFIVSSLNVPTYFIFGNHNLKELPYYENVGATKMISENEKIKHSHGAIYTGFKVKKENNILIAGCSGSINYNNGQCQFTELEMTYKLWKMIPRLLFNRIIYGRYLDIFLTHAPPRHIHDREDQCHKGFKCYRWFIKKFKPKYMIHGHIHLYDINEPRITTWKGCTIINAYSQYILNYEEKQNG